MVKFKYKYKSIYQGGGEREVKVSRGASAGALTLTSSGWDWKLRLEMRIIQSILWIGADIWHFHLCRLSDTVVWNPWPEKAEAMADLGYFLSQKNIKWDRLDNLDFRWWGKQKFHLCGSRPVCRSCASEYFHSQLVMLVILYAKNMIDSMGRFLPCKSVILSTLKLKIWC